MVSLSLGRSTGVHSAPRAISSPGDVNAGDVSSLPRNVQRERETSTAGSRVLPIVNFASSWIEDVRVIDCVFRGMEPPAALAHPGDLFLGNLPVEPLRK